jgi:hypothetical protein
MQINCEEESEALFYSIPVTMKVYDDIIIENYQYFRLDINFTGSPLVVQRSKLYLLYKGNNVLFNGDGV